MADNVSTEELRASIEKAIQARDSRAIVDVYEPRTLRDEWRVVTYLDGVDVDSRAATLDGALASFAAACGLNDDGTDPREENERLKRLLREAHEAVREFAPMCKGNECYGIAPREFHDENLNDVRVCDDDECARELGATEETEIYDVQHADAMRAARRS